MSKQNKPFSRFLSGWGFYAALAICLAGAGTAAWVAVNSTLDQIESPLPSPPVEEQAEIPAPKPPAPPAKPAEKKQEQVTKPKNTGPQNTSAKKPSPSSASSSSGKEPSKPAKPSAQPGPSAKSPASPFKLPLNTAVMAPFSGDKLVENVTLKEWRTHNGVDLKASKGDSVKAASAGKVTQIAFDPMWGTMVEITDGSLTAIYCGLSEQLTVKMHDTVKAGDLIGTVDQIPCEISLEPHLHFAVKKDGRFIDPLSLVS